jgi:hypothetical protein
MRKSTLPQPIVFAYARRADLFLSRHTADLLTELLMVKKRLLKRLEDKAFRSCLVDYGVTGVTMLAAGAFFSLITSFLV